MNFDFSVATYNVLANAYVRPDRYRNCPPAALEPGPRRRLLLDRIAALDVDLLCLQEVEPDAHEAIAARLGQAYAGVYAKRRSRPEGASLFARRACMSLEQHEVLHYQAHARGDDQLALLDRMTHAGKDATWILAGDLNATSQSTVVEPALARGLVLGARSQRPWDTCNANGRPRKLDYLLVPAGQLDARPGSLPALRRDTALPSMSEPSDHLPLRIDFRFVA